MVRLRPGARAVFGEKLLDPANLGSLAMENAFGILIGITICVGIIALIDWFGRRKDRQSRDRAA
jgi:hypothetical protein